MEASVLKSTKKILGLDEDYTPFDLDVLTHINAAFATLEQLGIGPTDGLFVEDEVFEWNDLELPAKHLAMVRTYVYLKVRSLFDPPPTSFAIEAMNKQIAEWEWRLTVAHDLVDYEFPEEIPLILDGGEV